MNETPSRNHFDATNASKNVKKKPAGTNASQNVKKKPASQQVNDKVDSSSTSYVESDQESDPEQLEPFFSTDSESDQEQFAPGYIGGWNYIGPRGGYWSTDDPKKGPEGPHRKFVQVRPGPEALLVATVVGIGGQR